MGSLWNPLGFQLHKLFCLLGLIFLFQVRGYRAINLEGLVLLGFRANVDTDPYGAFMNWNPDDGDPCLWSGVHCEDGRVQILDLSGLYLQGTLSPELGKLTYLKSLILYKNHFTGVIPKEFGELKMLELLDLSNNNLSGTIPAEIGHMLSLKRLNIFNNKFHGCIPLELGNLTMLTEIQFDRNLTFAVDSGICCLHRKFGHCIWQKGLKQLKEDSFKVQIKRKFYQYVDVLPWFFRKRSLDNCGERYCDNLPSSAEFDVAQNTQHLVDFVRRRLLQDPSNLPALPASGDVPPEPTTTVPPTRSSGSFPAISKDKSKPSPDPAANQSPGNPNARASTGNINIKKWIVICLWVVAALLLALAVIVLLISCRKRGVKTIRPWKTGISGQLQKAFVTGVPKLNYSELETACEDFSNILDTLNHMTLYKGTLSSGVEIAVASTSIVAFKDWSRRSEMAYRKKIETLSRVNHKNFVNLLGYCEEDEPFCRMMVFEYAPSGSLFEHLHVKEVEHLDWNARIRIIMGIAYCLQFMHELNPPVIMDDVKSNYILLTDDYAAKVADMGFWAELATKSKGYGDDSLSQRTLAVDAESNVYSFGILLLEIISGKLPFSEKEGSILDWASNYLNDKRLIKDMADPTLKSFKDTELDIVYDVAKECIHHDPRQRPTMREIVNKLRNVIPISPESATPRLSPLWWAELEILSTEAS